MLPAGRGRFAPNILEPENGPKVTVGPKVRYTGRSPPPSLTPIFRARPATFGKIKGLSGQGRSWPENRPKPVAQ